MLPIWSTCVWWVAEVCVCATYVPYMGYVCKVKYIAHQNASTSSKDKNKRTTSTITEYRCPVSVLYQYSFFLCVFVCVRVPVVRIKIRGLLVPLQMTGFCTVVVLLFSCYIIVSTYYCVYRVLVSIVCLHIRIQLCLSMCIRKFQMCVYIYIRKFQVRFLCFFLKFQKCVSIYIRKFQMHFKCVSLSK